MNLPAGQGSQESLPGRGDARAWRATHNHARVSEFQAAVREVLCRLAPGEVVTYGEIAGEAGSPGAARAVGRVLSKGEGDVPWWRVVTATGRLVPGHEQEQERLLATEGVSAAGGRVLRPKGSTGEPPGDGPVVTDRGSTRRPRPRPRP